MSHQRLSGWRAIVVALLITFLTLWSGALTLRAARSSLDTSGQQSPVVIAAVYYDGYELNDADEAVGLLNLTGESIDIGGWYLNDGAATRAIFPPGTVIPPGVLWWVTNDKIAFERQFAETPSLEPEKWPGFANAGDEVLLYDAGDTLVDAVVYGAGAIATSGWNGPPVEPYIVAGNFAAEGQILFRRRDPLSGKPVPDTDSQSDWAQTPDDPINGRQVRYPGWDSDQFFFPVQLRATATLTIAVAPDNAYDAVVELINSARSSIHLASLTVEQPGIVDALARAANRGAEVTLLLEGAPVGGLSDQGRFLCEQLAAAGGACYFMITDEAQDIFDRYRFMHAKYLVVDGRRAAISSENFSLDSMPADPKADGTWGRRGTVLITDAPGVVAHLEALFAADLDLQHVDILRWDADHPVYGAPPPGFAPVLSSGGITYTVRYSTPLIIKDALEIEVSQSPDNSLRAVDGLLGLVNRAGVGDTILVQQLNERPHWGPSSADPADNPNPRLDAYMAAARRGAKVRLLLDEFFDMAPDHPLSNATTCRRLNETAHREKLNLFCERGNPTGLGIHNKMVLAEIGGRGYVHVGSLNGTELSHKGNREVALLIQSDIAYAYLADLFTRDRQHKIVLPLVLTGIRGAADHPLISEIYYDPPGFDTGEMVEIVNPTIAPVNLAGWSLGDAVRPEDFEDVRVFPQGTVLAPGETLVIATTAVAFQAEFGFLPDLEIVDSDPTVPDMIDEPGWGSPEALFQLGNTGDEVILRQGLNAIDVVVYGDGNFPGIEPCPLLVLPDRTLERYPYWHDTDSCIHDFRGWPFASPGRLP